MQGSIKGSFSSDAASVMTGKRNGVASRLRAGNKTLISMCTAFAIVWHWHVAMLRTRFPTSRKQRKFYYRCGHSLKSAAYPKAVLAVKQLSVSNRGKKKLRKKFQKACRSRWLLREKATEGVYQDSCSKHFEFSKKMKMQLLLGYYSKKPT